MKLFTVLASITLFILTTTCNNQKSNSDSEVNSDSDTMEITGIIEPIGMTTWQYGTHTISNSTMMYALRSKEIDLKNYEGNTVTIKGKKIEGYPVENGPVFLEVTEILD